MEKKLPTKALPFEAAILSLLLIALTPFAQAQTCACDFVIEPPADRITPVFIDGLALGVKPGQTICLNAGFYMQIRLSAVEGTPDRPVMIQNCGGLVEIGDATNFGRWHAVDIRTSKYFRFSGSGDPSFKYGIKLGKSGDSGLKIGSSTDTEIDHIEIANTGFAGILAKSDYGGKPPVNAPEMNNVNIHDTYIHDTWGEGMYIGETKTPGQDFRHLQIWNNVVTRTGLETIQVANVVEDAQVFNNVMYKGGTRNALFQNKGFQIGDNSVGKYYNNILIGSPSNNMIIMGSGNIDIFNNYLSTVTNDAGFFIDNRSVSIPSAPINIYKNYILGVNLKFPFFSVHNEKNPVNITENKLEGANVMLAVASGAGSNVIISGNTNEVIEPVQFLDIDHDNFTLTPGSPYQGMGVLEDVSHLNKRPFISLIPDQEIDFETLREIPVSATDSDGDAMVLETFNLPPFVTFQDNGNGKGVFTLAPQANELGIYYKIRVRVTDSKGGMNSQYFSIKVMDPYAFIATASSKGGVNDPAYTRDNNMATRWVGTDGTGNWIKYDLREDKLVTSANIAFYNGLSTVYPFDIEVSEDDNSWVKVFSGTSSGANANLEIFSFDQVRARYLRIVDNGSFLNSYNEVVITCTTAPQFHLFNPTDDVYQEGSSVYDNRWLKVKEVNRKSFIRFSVSDLKAAKFPVVSAKLKLTAMESGVGSLKIYLARETNWSESNLSKYSLPTRVAILDTITSNFTVGQVYELDVISAIPDNGVYSFIIEFDDSNRGLSFSSNEGEFKPELEIQTLRGAQPYLPIVTNTGPVTSEFTIDGKWLEEFRLFPNPGRDKVTLDLGHTLEFVSVQITDQEGKIFYSKNWNSTQVIELDLNIPGMEPGTYYVKIQQNNSVEVVRLVRQ